MMKFHLLLAFVTMTLVCLSVGSARADQLDELLGLIQANQASNSVEQVLPLLPPSLRQNYVLMKKSMGLQKSSPENPRVLAFGEKGDFIVSFNGSSLNPGHSSLEILQFNHTSKQFEFYQLQFPLAQDEKGLVQRPTANPPLCLTCHTKSAKPLWSSSPEWPGAYGEANDIVTPDEMILYRTYLTHKTTHPRYSLLINYEDSPVAPFRASASFLNAEVRPNARLGALLLRYNSLQMAQRIREHGEFKKQLPLLFYFLNSCPPQSDQDLKSVLTALGRRSQEFDLTTLGDTPKGMNYSDGSEQGNARTFLMGALAADLLARWPDFEGEILTQPDSTHGLGRFALTSFDQRFSKGLDSILIPTRLHENACEKLLALSR